MLKNFLYVGLGGAVGCMARYGVNVVIGGWWRHHFPLGTFLVNMTGCFLIGILFGLGLRQPWMQGTGWLLLGTGFCGGYTTFSAFALENVQLLQRQQTMTAVCYAMLSVAAGIILCRVGMALTQ